MKIFTYEFETWIKSLVLCSWRGHKPGKWENTYWAVGHMGLPAKFCLRCGTCVKKQKWDWEKWAKVATDMNHELEYPKNEK